MVNNVFDDDRVEIFMRRISILELFIQVIKGRYGDEES